MTRRICTNVHGGSATMLIILLAYLGGILTILSPCILPVLPFVFARAGAQLRAQHAADARRHGGDLRDRRDAGRGRRRLGRAGQCHRPLGGADPARAVRHRVRLPAHLRPDDAAAGRARLAAVRTAAGRTGQHLVLGRARNRDRAVVGALRRPDPRHHLHRGRAQGRERRTRRFCCSPMRSARRPRSRSPCWSAARCSRG